jgi:hypothetical protein
MTDQLERKVTITYRWWNEKGIKDDHVKLLEEAAWARVVEMAKEGYTSGELHENVRTTDDDSEDGVEYSGWWELTTRNSNGEG